MVPSKLNWFEASGGQRSPARWSNMEQIESSTNRNEIIPVGEEMDCVVRPIHVCQWKTILSSVNNKLQTRMLNRSKAQINKRVVQDKGDPTSDVLVRANLASSSRADSSPLLLLNQSWMILNDPEWFWMGVTLYTIPRSASFFRSINPFTIWWPSSLGSSTYFDYWSFTCVNTCKIRRGYRLSRSFSFSSGPLTPQNW